MITSAGQICVQLLELNLTNSATPKSNPVIFITNPVKFNIYQVTFRKYYIPLIKNPVIIRTNPVKFMATQSYSGQIQ